MGRRTNSAARSAARRLAAALALGGSLCCAPSFAQSSSPDDLARRHFESGVAYLEESDWDNALAAFKKAHELSGRPEILINIATVYERRGRLPDAVTALREYLAAAPTGEHAEMVRRRLGNLERRAAETPAVTAPEPAPDQPADSPRAEPPPQHPGTAHPAPPPAPAAIEREPGTGRLPVYLAFGVGAASAAGAVLTGIFAQSEYDDAESGCSPTCTDEELSSGRALQLTSTLLTGVAVIGVGIGVTLLLVEPPARAGERATTASSHWLAATLPRLELGLNAAAGGPSFSGRVRF